MEQGSQIEFILDICLSRLAAGESIAACLQDYPQYAEELTPLLYVADELQQWEAPSLSPAAYAAAHLRARAAFNVYAAKQQRRRRWPRWPGFQATMQFGVAVMLGLLVLASIHRAAQPSLPGELLYPIKQAGEQFQLAATRKPVQRAALYLTLASRRTDEAIRLSLAGQPIPDTIIQSSEHNRQLAWETISAVEDIDEVAYSDFISRYYDELHISLQQIDEVLTAQNDAIMQSSLRQVRDSLQQMEHLPQMCSTMFTISSTHRGKHSTQGSITYIQGNRVGGSFIDGFLIGYTFNGSQDVSIDRKALTAQVQGSITIVGPNGQLTLQYAGQTDQSVIFSRQVEGAFQAVAGTGIFTNWQWQGRMIAHLDTIDPPHFTVNAIGPCSSRP